MTGSKALLPLRLPELGPSFGKLVTGTGRTPGGLQLDAVRYALATRMFEHAGEARRLAANGERGPAITTLSRANWLAAWEEAAAAVAELVWTRVSRQLTWEADRVAMPPALRRKNLPGPVERRALAARLGSAGARLVPALDDIERRSSDAFDATALDRAAMDAWIDSLRTAARRLEAAWLELEDRVEAELWRWDPVASAIASWRKPLWPVWLAGSVGLAAAIWLGLALRGFISAPEWLMPLVLALPG